MFHQMHDHLRKETRSSKEKRTQRKLAVLYQFQQGRCCLCSQHMNLRPAGVLTPSEERNGNFATLEHVIPRNRGGDNGFHNNLTSHSLCNSRRHHALPSSELILLRNQIHTSIRASDLPYANIAWTPDKSHPIEADILANG